MAAAQSNEVGNNSFESPQITAGGEVAGAGSTWGTYGNVYTENVTTRTNLSAEDGDQVIKTFGTSSGVYQTVATTPGDTFTETAYAELSASDPQTASGSYIYGQLLLIYGTTTDADVMVSNNTTNAYGTPSTLDQYYEGTITGTVPAGVTSMTVQLDAGSGADGSVFFDNVSFTESPASVPEPASLGLLTLAAIPLIRRRRTV